MKIVAAELLKLAKTVLRTEMTFSRSPKSDNSRMNVIHYEVSRFLDTVRKNEDLSTFVNRTDDGKTMKLKVGISDHEAVDAIAKEVLALAKKLARRNGFKMKKG